MDQFLLSREDPEEKIDIKTADKLAETASDLADRLTDEWELVMRNCQFNDENPTNANRENSTLDLLKSFDASKWIARTVNQSSSTVKKSPTAKK